MFCFVKSEGALVLSKAKKVYTPETAGQNISDINYTREETESMIMDRIALTLAIIGGINWGSIGLFRFDIVAWLFGGQTATVSRVIYTLVGLAALWCVSLLFRSDSITDEI